MARRTPRNAPPASPSTGHSEMVRLVDALPTPEKTAVDLAALGLIPSDPAPDAILMAHLERWSDLRRFVCSKPIGAPEGLPTIREYHALTETVAATRAVTVAGAVAKLEAALVAMGASDKGWRGTVWNLPIHAVQDALVALKAELSA